MSKRRRDHVVCQRLYDSAKRQPDEDEDEAGSDQEVIIGLVDQPAAAEDTPDIWQSYKDYLKRKRDYKREWRKRQGGHTPTASKRRRNVPLPGDRPRPTPPKPIGIVHQDRGMMPGKVFNSVKSVNAHILMDSPIEIIDHEESEADKEDEESLAKVVSLDTNFRSQILSLDDLDTSFRETVDGEQDQEGEEDEEEVVEELQMLVREEEPVVVTDVVNAEDGEFMDRRDLVFARLQTLSPSKRRRYLTIIEGLVEEACRP